jgi:hypothetical protein
MHHRPTVNDIILDRRDFLRRCGMGFGGLALGGLLGRDQAAATDLTHPARTVAGGGPHFAPKAKRVVHLFMNGGPSQVDTFDPKPALQQRHGQPIPLTGLKTERPTGAALRSPFTFDRYGQCGLEVSELFKHTAQHADDLCVIRSMTADVPNHEPSLMLMNCGEGRLARPSMGSWITYGLGSENENLPDYISLCPGGMPIKRAENWRAAFLPGRYQGTYIDTSIERVDQMIENLRNPVARDSRQAAQLDLLRQLNDSHLASHQHDPQLEARIRSFELAYSLQKSGPEVVDLSGETEETKSLYGLDKPETAVFGRNCLLGRRLVERGVRFVELYCGSGSGWDAHTNLEGNHKKWCMASDQPVAALLEDLDRRGMLQDTLVIWGGEFGRTPFNEKGNGRDHNPWGFTMFFAGGGVKGGQTIGTTDEIGLRAIERPAHVNDIHASILHLLGLNHMQLTYLQNGRSERPTILGGEHMVKELWGG